MYDIVGRVRGGASATLVRLVEARGMSSRWPGAVAAVERGAVAGRVVAGALDDQLADLPAGLHELVVSDEAAAGVGLSCGGLATVFVQPAADVPDEAWQRFADGRPVTLVTDLDGSRAGTTAIRDDSRIAVTETRVIEEDGVQRLVAAYRPTLTLVVAGEGLIADALGELSTFLGWRAIVSGDPAALDGLGSTDGVIVISHDDSVGVPMLAAAIRGGLGYIGALGSKRTQDRRAASLRERGVTAEQLAHVNGPAGLDIGSSTPAEIALAVAAELLAVVRGGAAIPLRDRGGPVHR
jgi:xanthine dehydrogenase accessory factor